MKFENYHPGVSLLYFAGVFAGTIICNHPVFVICSFVSAFACSVYLGGQRTLCANLIMIPCLALLWKVYTYFTHFGITVLGYNRIGNAMTLEAMVYGGVLCATVGALAMWANCFLRIFTKDKIIYLTGKVSPALSLYLSIFFRFAPRVYEKREKVSTARRGIGKGAGQGRVLTCIRHGISIASITLTYVLDDLFEGAASMKNRGYGLKGRSAFSIYRFDNRDRAHVVSDTALIMIVVCGTMLDQTRVLYDPAIIFNRFTPLSSIFFVAYAVFMFLPLMQNIHFFDRRGRTSKKNASF